MALTVGQLRELLDGKPDDMKVGLTVMRADGQLHNHSIRSMTMYGEKLLFSAITPDDLYVQIQVPIYDIERRSAFN